MALDGRSIAIGGRAHASKTDPTRLILNFARECRGYRPEYAAIVSGLT
jgi:hypothetical protein